MFHSSTGFLSGHRKLAPLGTVRAPVAAVFNTTNSTNAKSGEPSSMTTQPPNNTVRWSTTTRPYGCAIRAFSDARWYSPLRT